MKHFAKFLSLLLAPLLLILSLSACGTPSDEPTETTASGAPSESETEVDEAARALEAIGEVDWGGGEFTVIYADDLGGFDSEVCGSADESQAIAGTVINNAVYERNVLFEERCHLTYIQIGKSVGVIAGLIQGEAQSGGDSYQFISNASDQTANFATSGLLGNYLAYDIDFDHPWWDKGTLAFDLAGNIFFMSGAHNFVDNDVTYIMAFNKALAEERQLGDLYATVKSGDWTLEHFLETVQPLSTDNGDGKWDHEDSYGLATSHIIASTLFYGSNLQYVNIDPETNEPTLALDAGKMERASNVLTLARRLLHEGNAAFSGTAEPEKDPATLFIDNRAVFYCEAATGLTKFSTTMEEDYGVLPIPKYDKAQDTYYTWAHGVGSTLSFLTTNEKNEDFGKILETYVILSHNTVSPAYYDTLLKSRNVRDPESVEMLDMLFTNRICDMPTYFTQLALSNTFSDAVLANRDSFASQYKAASSRFDRALSQIMRNLNKQDE